ncbi:MAG: hypothetical protein F4X40_08840, partial [Chloroflexi bacterium]|nr:hypothetical protein [Chloroflexota bacterium]
MKHRPAAAKIIGGIYVIIDPDHCGGRDMFVIAEAAASAGAAVIQLRHKGVSKSIVADEARTVAKICEENDTVFIVNDYPDVAADAGAAGVHV